MLPPRVKPLKSNKAHGPEGYECEAGTPMASCSLVLKEVHHTGYHLAAVRYSHYGHDLERHQGLLA